MSTLIHWEWIIMFGIALGLALREILSYRRWRRRRDLSAGRGAP